jgi:hypothetical protein
LLPQIVVVMLANNQQITKNSEGIFCLKNKKSMYVVKENPKPMFGKITDRIKLCYGLNDLVDAVKVAMRVIEGLYDGVSSEN